jgi:hypothetical protein
MSPSLVGWKRAGVEREGMSGVYELLVVTLCFSLQPFYKKKKVFGWDERIDVLLKQLFFGR